MLFITRLFITSVSPTDSIMRYLQFISLILCIGHIFNSGLFAENDSFQKLRIKDKSFEQVLLDRKEIMSGLIDIITVVNQRYLVSVGICYMDAKPTPPKLLASMKYARIKAKEKVARLIDETMSSKESFTSHYEKIVKVDEEGNEETIQRVKETFLSFTQSESQQIIHSPDQKELGWWITAEGDQMGLAIAYPIK